MGRRFRIRGSRRRADARLYIGRLLRTASGDQLRGKVLAPSTGLWKGCAWGKWLGALSGALYVPFELRHLLYLPTLDAAAVIGINVALVCFLGLQLWRERLISRSSSG